MSDTQRLMMLFIEKLFKLSYTAAQMHSGLGLEKNTKGKGIFVYIFDDDII